MDRVTRSSSSRRAAVASIVIGRSEEATSHTPSRRFCADVLMSCKDGGGTERVQEGGGDAGGADCEHQLVTVAVIYELGSAKAGRIVITHNEAEARRVEPHTCT